MNFKFWNAGGGKSEGMVHVVKNAETVNLILAGQPCVFAMNGTDDGLAVLLPSSAGAAKTAAFTAGVAVKNISPGKMQNVQVYGFNRHTKVLRSTRASSTNDWVSGSISYTIGDVLVADTVGNGWVKSGTVTNGTEAQVVVAASLSAFGSQVSSNNGGNAASALSYYDAVKTFIRLM